MVDDVKKDASGKAAEPTKSGATPSKTGTKPTDRICPKCKAEVLDPTATKCWSCNASLSGGLSGLFGNLKSGASGPPENQGGGIGNAFKALIGALVYGAIVIYTMLVVFSENLYSLMGPVFAIIGFEISLQFFQAMLVVAGLAVAGGLAYLVYKGKLGTSIGIFIFFIVVVVVVALLPTIMGFVGSMTGNGNPLAAAWCAITQPGSTTCYSTDGGEEASFSGLKTYNTLRITLGNRVYPGSALGGGAYREGTEVVNEVPTIYGGEPFYLPFYIKNLNEEDSNGGGLSFTNLKIGTGADRQCLASDDPSLCDPNLKETHVWAYINRSARGGDSSIGVYEAQSIDVCSSSNPCNIKPRKEIKVYAEEFSGGKKSCIKEGYPCNINSATKTCTPEDDCPDAYHDTVLCFEVEQLEFEVAMKYQTSVAHTRTLVVAKDENELAKLPANSIPSLMDEVPTDGPLDLVIDFDSPYVISGRRDVLKMTVDIVNGGNGKYKPNGTLFIDSIGSFPEWITGASGDCSLNNDRISISKKFSSKDLFISGTKSFVCDLDIDADKALADIESYKHVSFTGNFTYIYLEKRQFFGGSNVMEVNDESCTKTAQIPTDYIAPGAG